uniref:Uncharacterized protein n=1 Tax=Romanomermis culicivorax TaxID=13658 RepID=A0A915L657_ROMCU
MAVLPMGYVFCNDHAKRLYDDLMSSYNRLNRPVNNTNDTLTVKLKLRLAQIIDLHEKDQIMISSIWLQQEWQDYKLTWDPAKYHNTSVLYVPTDMIWIPDLLIYNSIESKMDLIQGTKATIYANGTVRWEAPALARTICTFKRVTQMMHHYISRYPFDIQSCEYKFGSWSFPEEFLDLQHFDKANYSQELIPGTNEWQNISIVKHGIDLSDYYPSVEWEVLEIPAVRRVIYYTNRMFNPRGVHRAGYVVMLYRVELRRYPLFHVINLVFPCVSLLFLTVIVFYLPTESGEKIGLSINLLVCLTVFFLPLTESFSANSDASPLIVEFLIFILIMISIAIIMTIYVLNLRFRSPNTHRMPKWMKNIFMKKLPKYLLMNVPETGVDDDSFRKVSVKKSRVELTALPTLPKPECTKHERTSVTSYP